MENRLTSYFVVSGDNKMVSLHTRPLEFITEVLGMFIDSVFWVGLYSATVGEGDRFFREVKMEG